MVSKDRTQYAIYTYDRYGPTFGRGGDIYISGDASTKKSYTYFGNNYKLRGYEKGKKKTKELLAGSFGFLPSEIEVYYEN